MIYILRQFYINTIVYILDIIQRPVYLNKHFGDKSPVSETLYKKIKKVMNKVEKVNNCSS
jgi:hypothetical protein